MKSSSTLSAHKGVTPAEWERFVSASDDALLFHRNDWLQVLSHTQGGQLERYGLYSESNPRELVGVMPVFFRRFGPFQVAASPLVVEDTPYMGPVISDNRFVAGMRALRDQIGRRAVFLRVLLPHRVPEVAGSKLEAAGFTVITKKTHRLDLSVGASDVWDQMEGRCRTAVRKARKSGVETTRTTDAGPDLMRRYYALVEDVYGRQGRPTPNSFEFYQQLWRDVSPSGILSLIMAQVDGKDIAGALFAHDDSRVYYLDGASDYEHRKFNASNLVLWEAVEWAASSGKKEFDFVGSDIPRLARFKASFGGLLVEHSCLEWARSGPVRLARDWYGRYGKTLLAKLRQRTRGGH